MSPAFLAVAQRLDPLGRGMLIVRTFQNVHGRELFESSFIPRKASILDAQPQDELTFLLRKVGERFPANGLLISLHDRQKQEFTVVTSLGLGDAPGLALAAFMDTQLSNHRAKLEHGALFHPWNAQWIDLDWQDKHPLFVLPCSVAPTKILAVGLCGEGRLDPGGFDHPELVCWTEWIAMHLAFWWKAQSDQARSRLFAKVIDRAKLGVILLDSNSSVIFTNAEAERLLAGNIGITRANNIGRQFRRFRQTAGCAPIFLRKFGEACARLGG